MSKEKVIYRDDDVTITNSRAVFGSTTYSVANITSVSLKTWRGATPASPYLAALLSVVSLVCFSGSVVMMLLALLPAADGDISGTVFGLRFWGPIVGVFFVGMIGGYLLYRTLPKEKRPDTFEVKLRTASGEVGALSVLRSEDQSRVDEVVQALNRAIADE